MATCPSGQGAVCKTAYTGSIPVVASTLVQLRSARPRVEGAHVPADACPVCGSPRRARARYCRQCKADFWRVAASEPTRPRPGRRLRRSGLLVVGVLLGIAVAIAILVGGEMGRQPQGTVPAPGEIWFGETYDRATFVVDGRTGTLRPNARFAMVAHPTRPVEALSILLRVFRDGALVRTTGPDARWDSGEMLGFTLTAPLAQGTWRYEVTDLAGTMLATGTVQVR